MVESILQKDSSQLAAILQKLAKLIDDKSESIYFNKLVADRIDLKNITVADRAFEVSAVAAL